MKKITDFGNKIGGARKDLWKTQNMSIEDLELLNDAECKKYVTRDYVWLIPNSKKLVEDGLDPFIAFWQREVRKCVNKSPYVYNGQSEKAAMSIYIRVVGTIRDYVMSITDRSQFKDFYKLVDERFGYERREWVQCIQSSSIFGIRYKENRMLNRMRNSNFPYGTPKKDSKKQRKKAFVPPQLTSIERGGKDYRHGFNVDAKWWQKDFDFYGVQFGNWLSQKDRQYSMNYCFDALKDLSYALQISDKDISFGGNLSLAFGARGNSRASAHYESLRRVINLTKMHGAGCTAHEWMHALDHAIALHYGITDQVFASESKQTDKLPEIFVKLVRSLDHDVYGVKTDYAIGSEKFDTKYQKDTYGYWCSPVEMLARAFACYVKDQLGYKSDYLIAHADCYVFEFDNMRACAIPQDEEREIFNELFDRLFYQLKKDGLLHKYDEIENDDCKTDAFDCNFHESLLSFKHDGNGQYTLF